MNWICYLSSILRLQISANPILRRLNLMMPALQNRNSRWVLWLMHLTDQEIEFLNERLHFTADLLKMITFCSLAQREPDCCGRFEAKPGRGVIGRLFPQSAWKSFRVP